MCRRRRTRQRKSEIQENRGRTLIGEGSCIITFARVLGCSKRQKILRWAIKEGGRGIVKGSLKVIAKGDGE